MTFRLLTHNPAAGLQHHGLNRPINCR